MHTNTAEIPDNGQYPHRWKKGVSANPGGRPKKTQEERNLVAACKQKTPEALGTIVDLMQNSKNERVKLAAAQFIIERGWGKAPLVIEHEPIVLEISRDISPEEAYMQMLNGGILEGEAVEIPPDYVDALESPPPPPSCLIGIDALSAAASEKFGK